ncbi:phage late control gene D protein [Geobacter sp. OR-1]|uniref:phage late control D family protein n=1 Tax=Geobacter sp. OR-1 TaxID=1266765 RepID=UPI00054376E0|nr:phage late control D family protein [Geobacter sp. OR-1]GAM10176.1 phage late control gene D protein [Geobacter sp. OR-1]
MPTPQQYVPAFVIRIGGIELRHGFNFDVLSLSVTDCCNQGDSFAFTVRERHPERGRFPAGGTLQWLDSGTFEEGKEVEIELGYLGNCAMRFVGQITAINPTFPESGVPTLAVRGQGLYCKLLVQCDARPFREQTDSGIAREIATLLGLDARVDDTRAEHRQVTSGTATYAAILQERATRIGYEVVVKERTLCFEKPRYLVDRGPQLTLEWGRSLRSFSPTLSTYRKLTHVRVRASQTTLGRGKEPLVHTAGPGDERARLGSESASEIAMRLCGENRLLAEDHLAASQEEAMAVAVAKLEASSIEFISGRGVCIGNPELRARSVIELKGLGANFSGCYYVTSVTHTIDGTGYRCDFEVKRNGR